MNVEQLKEALDDFGDHVDVRLRIENGNRTDFYSSFEVEYSNDDLGGSIVELWVTN